MVGLCLVHAVLFNQGHDDARGPCMTAHWWGQGELPTKGLQSHKQQRETLHCAVH